VTQGPHRPTDPKRLTVVGATDLERTLLQAARRERPSPELTKRMAAGLGISAVVGTTAAALPAAAVTAAAAKTSFGLWVSGGVLAAAVAAGVVGVRMSAPKPAARPADRPAPAAVATPVEAPAIEAAAPTPAIAADRRIDRAHRRVQPAAPALPAADLRDQIARGARVAKGTIYLYFKSKDEILKHALYEDVDTLARETIPPVIACPTNVVVTLPPNTMDTRMAVNYPAPTATDNCTVSPIITTSLASGSVFPVGVTTVNVTATDAANNQATCSFTVTVLYNFSSFFSPIANAPTVNVVNAGRAIPIKFSLSGTRA